MAILAGNVPALQLLLDACLRLRVAPKASDFAHLGASAAALQCLVQHPLFLENVGGVALLFPNILLALAAKLLDAGLTRRLLDLPFFSAKLTDSAPAFKAAVKRGCVATAALLLERLPVDLHKKSPVETMALAIRNDDAPMAQLLIDAGCPLTLEHVAKHGQDPLSLACFYGCGEPLFKLLLATTEDALPHDTLSVAIKGRCPREVLVLLIHHHAPLNASPYPLLAACEVGSLELIHLLLDAGADPVKCNLVHAAASAGQLEAVRLLVARECPCDTPASDQTTPLYKAVLKGHYEVAKFLIESGANKEFIMTGGFSLMYAAAEFGFLPIVELLFSLGCEFDRPNIIDGATPLYMTAQNGHLEIAKLLVAAGANLDVLFKQSHSLLYVAAEHGRDEMVSYLLSIGADPNRPSSDGSTPLYAAIKSRHASVITILLDHGADINHLSKIGLSPCWIASAYGFPELVRLLLDRGCAFDLPSNVDGTTALYNAVLHNQPSIVEMLIQAGASLTVKNTTNGFDLVYLAVENHRTTILTQLLRAGCEIDHVTPTNYTPLYAAVKRHSWDIAKILLDHGANPNHTLPSSGFTPMYIASEIGKSSMVRKLLAAKALPDIPNTIDSATPVYIAAQNGHLSIVKALIAAGANPHITLTGGYNMVYVAAQFGRQPVCEYLVDFGVAFDQPCEVSSTPLYMAVRNGHLDIAEFLLSRGADKNVIHRDGFSLMYLACERGYYAFAEKLLTMGALYDIPNHKDGATPLYMATQHGYMNLVKLLLAQGAKKTVTLTGGFTLMYTASEYGHTRLVEYLLSIDCAVDTPNVIDGATPLYIAAERGHWEILKLLIQGGAKVDATLSGYRSALGAACSNGHRRAAEVLLENGAHLILGKFNPLSDIRYYSSDVSSLLKTVKYNMAMKALTLQHRCWLSTIVNFLDTSPVDSVLVDFYNEWLRAEVSDLELVTLAQDILRNIQHPEQFNNPPPEPSAQNNDDYFVEDFPDFD